MERLTYRSAGIAFVKGRTDNDEVVERLAFYEDVEEQGLLVMLPCKVGDLVWVCYPKFKRITKVMYTTKSDILDDVECGAIICRTREEAEAAIAAIAKEN